MGADRGVAVTIWPSVRSAFVAFSSPLEGAIPHFYRDVRGLVTVAIGVLVDPIELALTLPMRWPDGRLATRAEIAADWWKVRGDRSLSWKGAAAASKVALLRLAPEDVEAVTLEKLDTIAKRLAVRFPGFETWPADAQLGVLSMAWACGAGFNFPKCEAALRALDFATAAAECSIREVGNPGVAPRNRANRQLFQLATRSIADGRDPSLLLYPVSPA